MSLNKQHLTRLWAVTVCLFLFSTFVVAQGWEAIEEDIFEIPGDIIVPTQGAYLTAGTTVVPGAGIVLKLDRVDLEGQVIFSKNYDIIDPTAGAVNDYKINEFELNNEFLITGPRIGYVKFSDTGEILWQQQVNQLNLDATDLIIWSSITDNNEAFIVAQGFNNALANVSLVKISADGNPIWDQTYEADYHLEPIANITTSDNGSAIICDYEDGAEYGTVIIRTNSEGTELWTQKYPTLTAQKRTFVQDQSGNLLFVDNATGDNRIHSVDADGNIMLLQTITQDVILTAAKLIVDLEGNIILTGHRNENNQSSPTFVKLDSNGNEIWTRLHQVQDAATIISTTIDRNNKIVSVGQNFVAGAMTIEATAYRVSVDPNGDIYDNFVTGNVYSDNNADCNNNTNDFPLSNWLIEASGNINFYGLTDEQGNYSIPVPIGDYEVTVSSPSPFYDACTSSYQITVTDEPNIFSLDFGMVPSTACPFLQVEVSVPFLRFCNEQFYYVDYCNYGTEAATNVNVTVLLDNLLTYVSASPIQPTTQVNNSLHFDIPGTLQVGECGQFIIKTALTCDEEYVGSTACVEASIAPLCDEQTEISPNLRVEGYCEGDSILFSIINDGNTTMITDRNFIVIEDYVILRVGTITEDIEPQDSVSLRVPANMGATVNLLVEQAPIFPTLLGELYATATVEGCNGLPSLPYTYSNFYDDDLEVWHAEECEEIISSFDPNDKKVIPYGIDIENHFILPNTSMEYKIRFQNTGTDTAFLVVLRDSISRHLDLRTFIPGASSHPYKYEILGNGYLKFSFENILLPDSTTNEAASHGFVKYTIRQRPDLPINTVIENRAGIYFDFNSPVITNTTWNTIGELGEVGWVVPTENISTTIINVKVFPNPFTAVVNFEIVSDQFDHLFEEKQFKLYNSMGQLMQTRKFNNSTYQFHKNDLPVGIYYYEIHQDGIAFNSGKLIIQ